MKNIGTIDKVIRIIVGIGLLSLLFLLKDNYRYFGLLGLIPLITAAIGICPTYSLLGINTCGKSGCK